MIYACTCAGAHGTGRDHVTAHVHSIDGEIQTWQMYYYGFLLRNRKH